VSFHLTRLKYAGLVVGERRGQQVMYRINPDVIKKGGAAPVLDVQGCVLSFPKKRR
jgi:DNA-binding transcriptional ArsR family regulator